MFLSPCFSARLKRPAKEPVSYCKEALRQDLTRVQIAWDECQSSRDRNAIYGYLTAVFDLVMWWAAEDRAISRHVGLRLQGATHQPPTNRLRQLSVHRRSSKKLTSERDQNGRECSVTVPSTNRMLNRLPPSFGVKVASTSVHLDLRVASGEAVGTSV